MSSIGSRMIRAIKNLMVDDETRSEDASAGKSFPFIEASASGELDSVKAMLASGVDVEERNFSGRTALICASIYGHTEVVNSIVQANANLDVADLSGWTALRYAISSGQLEVAHALIQAGANVNMADVGNYMGSSYSYAGGVTPLMVASEKGYVDLVRKLIEAGADVQAVTPDGKTSFSLAQTNGHFAVCDVLAEARNNEEQPVEAPAL